MRGLTIKEREILQAQGCSASCWDQVLVSDDFRTEQLQRVRLIGDVRIGSNSHITYSTIANYHIGNDCYIDSVLRIECRHSSTFGNGVMVAAVNENEGRSTPIYVELTAQTAYIMAMMRNRLDAVNNLKASAMRYAEAHRNEVGTIGNNVTIIGAKFIREVTIMDNTSIEGASLLENGTICNGCRIGVDVRARDFIISDNAIVESAASIARCFIGENTHLANSFTAADSLFFANCHCENGEAAAIFAGPFTVSHHKSSLLIAGIFSFFNAGSGTNQSNHLFKSGAVHQSVHLRGSKFGSNAYVMSPAIEGPYTVILGRHTRHHDTQDMPYSYLIEEDGSSTLIPAIALRSYGTIRDTQKWQQRDKRQLKHDNIHFEEFNPYITGKMLRGVDILTRLYDEDPEAKTFTFNRTIIKSAMLQRGIKLYNSAIVAAIGSMLKRGNYNNATAECRTEWVDIAGEYMPSPHLERILRTAEKPNVELEDIRKLFDEAMTSYDDMAAGYAYHVLSSLLGHNATENEVAEAITAADNILIQMREATEADRQRDTGTSMMIGYGYDFRDEVEQHADFTNTR